MRTQYTTWLALLLAAAPTFAQTSTSCNPTEKTCPKDTALSSSTYTHDFTTSGADPTNWNVTAGNVTYTSSGAEFTITKSGDAPTIQSKWYLFFGRVSFFLRAAPGTGIVSSAILESDDLDEIDLEWLGGTPYVDKVQSNFFGKGNSTSYDRAAWAAVSSTQSTTHNYTISWTKAATVWYIDDVAVRTLNYADASALEGKNYPQTPMNVRIGIWAGGDEGNDQGTIEWAGGVTSYDEGPFTMFLEKVEVVNENPAETYEYEDLTGDYGSIKIEGGESGSSSSSSEGSATATTVQTSSSTTATQSGMWWTASAEAVAQAAASGGSGSTSLGCTVGLERWWYGVFGLMVLGAVGW